LVTSFLLSGDQKVNIIKYLLQTTPIYLLKNNFSERVDSLTKQRGVREICGLPTEMPLSVYYTVRKLPGLRILCVKYEASLQHVALCQNLQKIKSEY